MGLVEVKVEVEELTAAALRPFGELISAEAVELADAPTQPGGHRMADLGLEIDGMPALFVIRFPVQAMVATRFERHLTMTEGRVALDEPAVILVAGSSEDSASVKRPDPESVRAFLIRPGSGLLFHRGAWHALGCFPVRAASANFAFYSEQQAELELKGPDAVPNRTEFFDFADEGLSFRVEEPIGIL